MNAPRDILTSRQLTVILFSALIGVNIFIMPRLVSQVAGRDGWISLLIGGMWALLVTVAGAYLAGQFPRKPPHVWLTELVGKWWAGSLIIIYSLYLLIVSASTIRLFADTIRVYLLARTPSEVIVITVLLTVVYAVANGINPLARVTQIFFLFAIIPSVVIIFTFLRGLDFTEMLPIMNEGVMPVIIGLLPAYGEFAGWGIIFYLVQFMDTPREAVKAAAIAVGSLVVIYIGLFTITLASFGPVELKYLLYPLVELIREMRGISGFLEKLDLIFLSSWIMSVFVTIAFFYYTAILAVSQLMGLKERYQLVYLGLPLAYLMALLPCDYRTAETIAGLNNYASVALSIAVPLTLIRFWFKKRQGGLSDA